MKSTRVFLQLDKRYFPLPLDCRWLDGARWQLLAPFEYHDRKGKIHRAEAEFITDFGSKPWWCWFLVGSPTDEGGPAYVIHDWEYENATWPRSITDRTFYECLRDLAVYYLKRLAMYYAVRVWSFF